MLCGIWFTGCIKFYVCVNAFGSWDMTMREGNTIMLTNLPVIDTGVPDIYVSGTACVEMLDDNMLRITYFTKQRSAIDRTDQAVIVARLVVSKSLVLAGRVAIDQLLAATVPKVEPCLAH